MAMNTTDTNFLIDQLTNSMEFYDLATFVELSDQTNEPNEQTNK